MNSTSYNNRNQNENLVSHITYITVGVHIREYDSTLYVEMVQGVLNSQYIGIGTKSRKAPKTAKTRIGRVKYKLFLH